MESFALSSIRLRRYVLPLAAFWTALTAGLLVLNFQAGTHGVLNNARQYVRSAVEEELACFKWTAYRGGVYAPADKDTPPNPYLAQLPERDITTPSGRRLTLISPSYVTRWAQRLRSEPFELHRRVTSLKPRDPKNSPDAWEAEALRSLEDGAVEILSIEKRDGVEYLRLMRPLIVEKPCLKCHPAQGRRLGKPSGGISASVPLARFQDPARRGRLIVVLSVAALWLVGLGGIYVGAVRLKNRIRERDRAMEELRLSEDKYAKAFRNSPSWVVLSSLDEGRFLDVNDTFLSSTGFTREEVIGRTSVELGTWVDPEERARIVAEIKARGSVRDVEVKRRTKSGRVLEMLFSGESIDIGGEKCLLSTALDISRLKKAYQELADSQRLLTAIFDASPVGIGVVQDRMLGWANRTMYRLVGYDEGELYGKSAEVLYLDREEYERVGRELYVQTANDDMRGVVTRWVRKDGTVFDCLLRAARLNPSDPAQGWIVMVTDISEEKRRQKELMESRRLYHAILEASPDPFVVYDNEGRVVYLNPAFTRVFGWSLDELKGKRVDFVPEDQKERTSRKIKELYAVRRQVAFETRRLTKDGTVLDVAVSAAYYGGADGESEGMVVNLKDITEQKRLDRQLRQAQKMEAIGTMAAGIAHDFNNILAAMTGYTELALMDLPEDSPIRKNLEQVLKAGGRARNLVKQILSFSRQTEHEPKPIHIGPIIKEALKFLRASIPTSIEIKQRIDPKSGAVLADPTEIHQVVLNLCSNAAQAMRDGGVLEVSLENMSFDRETLVGHFRVSPGRYLKLTVSDTGHGMDKETRERIFDPFFTTKERSEGTGLGLAVVHGIVRRHGGAISVYSEPGQGATFHIYLPALESETEGEQAAVGLEPLSTGTEHILFLDDEEALVEMGRQMLERLGYRVTTKTSSLEALEEFRAHPQRFDLVITDLTMPKMTGDKLALEMKKIRPDVPIIICTGYSYQIPAEKIDGSGVDRVITKPLVIGELAEAIREVLE